MRCSSRHGGRGEPVLPGRGRATFGLESGAVVLATGGVGGNHDLVRADWPGGPDPAPHEMLSGVPDSTDGLMLGVAERAGGRIDQPRPDVALPGGRRQPLAGLDAARHPHPCPGRARCGWTPSATGCRTPLFPGFDALGATAAHHWPPAARTPGSCWTCRRIGPEFSLSGSEQNPDIAQKSVKLLLTTRAGGKITPPVQAFLDNGVDFLTAPTVAELVGEDERPGRRAADRRRRSCSDRRTA